MDTFSIRPRSAVQSSKNSQPKTAHKHHKDSPSGLVLTSKISNIRRSRNSKHFSNIRATVHQQKQHLYTETLSLKQKYNQVFTENIKLRTRIATLQKQILKKNQFLIRRNQNVANIESNTLIKQKQMDSILVTNLKNLLRQQRSKYQVLQEKYQQIKKQIQYTKIKQLQLQLKAFEDQTIRLKGILAQINYQNKQQRQAIKKLTKISKKLKQKQQQNVMLLDLNIQYETILKQTKKQIKDQQQQTKLRQSKLLNDLDCARRRLATSLKRRQILQNENQNNSNNQSLISKNKILLKSAIINSKQAQHSFSRPLTASHKINRVILNKQDLKLNQNVNNKQQQQYQNIYDYDDFEQDNDNDMMSKKKINTIIEQGQEQFDEFDQLCYLMTYRFVAQQYNFQKFKQMINDKYNRESMTFQEIQIILQSQPFFLEDQQSQFLMKYLFEYDQKMRYQKMKVQEFYDVIKQSIHQYITMSISQVKQTRIKVLQNALQNDQKIKQEFSKNEYLNHDEFYNLLEELQFSSQQIQQIIAQMSLFIFDLNKFCLDAFQKYVQTLQAKTQKSI